MQLKRTAVIQAVGRCCLNGYEALGRVWMAPDLERATARCPCTRPTTQLLHQATGIQKNVASLVDAGSNPREDISLFCLQSHHTIMFVIHWMSPEI